MSIVLFGSPFHVEEWQPTIFFILLSKLTFCTTEAPRNQSYLFFKILYSPNSIPNETFNIAFTLKEQTFHLISEGRTEASVNSDIYKRNHGRVKVVEYTIDQRFTITIERAICREVVLRNYNWKGAEVIEK